MKSKPLTSALRMTIKKRLLDHRFAKEEEKLEHREHALAERAYKKLVGASNVTRINQIPEGWLPTIGSVDISTGERHYTSVSLAERRPAPNKHLRRAVQVSPRDSLGAAVRQFDEDLKELKKRKRDLGAEIENTLQSFRTTKQLVEAWPEAADFIPQAEQPKQVPAVPVERLNAALALQQQAESA